MRPRIAVPALAAALAAALLVPGVAAAGGQNQPIVADLNGDGLVDRATLGPEAGVPSGTPNCTISVELRKPNGSYKPAVVHSYPSPWLDKPYCPDMGEAINMARNGKAEIVLANFYRSGQPALFALKNYRPAGTFADLGFPSTIQAADFNGDGRMDIWESSDETVRLRTFMNTGAGALVPGPINVCSQRSIPQHVLADFNGDGGQDFLVALNCLGSQTVQVLFGDGQTPVTLMTGIGAVFEVDLGGDGIPDAGVITDTGTRYFHNNGHGVFTETTPLVAPAPPHVPSNAAIAAQQARFSHR